jgi:DNA-binding NtrC family response regulator
MRNLETDFEKGSVMEKKRLETIQALETCKLNLKATARKLKLSVNGLCYRIREWKIDLPNLPCS